MSKGADNLSVVLKFLLGGFLNAGPYGTFTSRSCNWVNFLVSQKHF